MEEFLFILDGEYLYAFSPALDKVEQLQYKGEEKKPFDAQDENCFYDYFEYILDEYKTTENPWLAFVCGEPALMTGIATTLALNSNLTSVGIYTLPYLLPLLCDTMKTPKNRTVCITFKKYSWNVKGLKVTLCSQTAQSPYILQEKDLARLFFATPALAPVVIEQKRHLPKVKATSELGKYVEKTIVQPPNSSNF